MEQCSAAENTNEWEGMILYDSQYAYGVTRLFNPDTNLGLATTVASLVDAVRSKMKLDFTHVRSLRGIHGNEIADRLAKRGANNHLTPLHGLDSPPPPPSCSGTKTSGQGGATSPCGSHARMSEVPKRLHVGTFIIQILVEAQAKARKNHEKYSHSEESLAQGLIGAITKKAAKNRAR